MKYSKKDIKKKLNSLKKNNKSLSNLVKLLLKSNKISNLNNIFLRNNLNNTMMYYGSYANNLSHALASNNEKVNSLEELLELTNRMVSNKKTPNVNLEVTGNIVPPHGELKKKELAVKTVGGSNNYLIQKLNNIQNEFYKIKNLKGGSNQVRIDAMTNRVKTLTKFYSDKAQEMYDTNLRIEELKKKTTLLLESQGLVMKIQANIEWLIDQLLKKKEHKDDDDDPVADDLSELEKALTQLEIKKSELQIANVEELEQKIDELLSGLDQTNKLKEEIEGPLKEKIQGLLEGFKGGMDPAQAEINYVANKLKEIEEEMKKGTIKMYEKEKDEAKFVGSNDGSNNEFYEKFNKSPEDAEKILPSLKGILDDIDKNEKKIVTYQYKNYLRLSINLYDLLKIDSYDGDKANELQKRIHKINFQDDEDNHLSKYMFETNTAILKKLNTNLQRYDIDISPTTTEESEVKKLKEEYEELLKIKSFMYFFGYLWEYVQNKIELLRIFFKEIDVLRKFCENLYVNFLKIKFSSSDNYFRFKPDVLNLKITECFEIINSPDSEKILFKYLYTSYKSENNFTLFEGSILILFINNITDAFVFWYNILNPSNGDSPLILSVLNKPFTLFYYKDDERNEREKNDFDKLFIKIEESRSTKEDYTQFKQAINELPSSNVVDVYSEAYKLITSDDSGEQVNFDKKVIEAVQKKIKRLFKSKGFSIEEETGDISRIGKNLKEFRVLHEASDAVHYHWLFPDDNIYQISERQYLSKILSDSNLFTKIEIEEGVYIIKSDGNEGIYAKEDDDKIIALQNEITDLQKKIIEEKAADDGSKLESKKEKAVDDSSKLESKEDDGLLQTVKKSKAQLRDLYEQQYTTLFNSLEGKTSFSMKDAMVYLRNKMTSVDNIGGSLENTRRDYIEKKLNEKTDECKKLFPIIQKWFTTTTFDDFQDLKMQNDFILKIYEIVIFLLESYEALVISSKPYIFICKQFGKDDEDLLFRASTETDEKKKQKLLLKYRDGSNLTQFLSGGSTNIYDIAVIYNNKPTTNQQLHSAPILGTDQLLDIRLQEDGNIILNTTAFGGSGTGKTWCFFGNNTVEEIGIVPTVVKKMENEQYTNLCLTYYVIYGRRVKDNEGDKTVELLIFFKYDKEEKKVELKYYKTNKGNFEPQSMKVGDDTNIGPLNFACNLVGIPLQEVNADNALKFIRAETNEIESGSESNVYFDDIVLKYKTKLDDNSNISEYLQNKITPLFQLYQILIGTIIGTYTNTQSSRSSTTFVISGEKGSKEKLAIINDIAGSESGDVNFINATGEQNLPDNSDFIGESDQIEFGGKNVVPNIALVKWFQDNISNGIKLGESIQGHIDDNIFEIESGKDESEKLTVLKGGNKTYDKSDVSELDEFFQKILLYDDGNIKTLQELIGIQTETDYQLNCDQKNPVFMKRFHYRCYWESFEINHLISCILFLQCFTTFMLDQEINNDDDKFLKLKYKNFYDKLSQDFQFCDIQEAESSKEKGVGCKISQTDLKFVEFPIQKPNDEGKPKEEGKEDVECRPNTNSDYIFLMTLLYCTFNVKNTKSKESGAKDNSYLYKGKAPDIYRDHDEKLDDIHLATCVQNLDQKRKKLDYGGNKFQFYELAKKGIEFEIDLLDLRNWEDDTYFRNNEVIEEFDFSKPMIAPYLKKPITSITLSEFDFKQPTLKTIFILNVQTILLFKKFTEVGGPYREIFLPFIEDYQSKKPITFMKMYELSQKLDKDLTFYDQKIKDEVEVVGEIEDEQIVNDLQFNIIKMLLIMLSNAQLFGIRSQDSPKTTDFKAITWRKSDPTLLDQSFKKIIWFEGNSDERATLVLDNLKEIFDFYGKKMKGPPNPGTTKVLNAIPTQTGIDLYVDKAISPSLVGSNINILTVFNFCLPFHKDIEENKIPKLFPKAVNKEKIINGLKLENYWKGAGAGAGAGTANIIGDNKDNNLYLNIALSLYYYIGFIFFLKNMNLMQSLGLNRSDTDWKEFINSKIKESTKEISIDISFLNGFDLNESSYRNFIGTFDVFAFRLEINKSGYLEKWVPLIDENGNPYIGTSNNNMSSFNLWSFNDLSIKINTMLYFRLFFDIESIKNYVSESQRNQLQNGEILKDTSIKIKIGELSELDRPFDMFLPSLGYLVQNIAKRYDLDLDIQQNDRKEKESIQFNQFWAGIPSENDFATFSPRSKDPINTDIVKKNLGMFMYFFLKLKKRKASADDVQEPINIEDTLSDAILNKNMVSIYYDKIRNNDDKTLKSMIDEYQLIKSISYGSPELEPDKIPEMDEGKFNELQEYQDKNVLRMYTSMLMVLYGVQAQSSWALLHMFTANPQKIVSVDTISRFMELSYAVTQKQTEGAGNIDRLTDDDSILIKLPDGNLIQTIHLQYVLGYLLEAYNAEIKGLEIQKSILQKLKEIQFDDILKKIQETLKSIDSCIDNDKACTQAIKDKQDDFKTYFESLLTMSGGYRISYSIKPKKKKNIKKYKIMYI